MIVKTESGRTVSIIKKEKWVLIDTQNREWVRNGPLDTLSTAAYTCDTETFQANIVDLRRISMGLKEINRCYTVEEMRDAATRLPAYQREIVDMWSDQKLREILADCDTKDTDAGEAMSRAADKEFENSKPKPISEPQEDTEKPIEKPKGTKRPPRGKVQEGGFQGTFEECKVILTPKQVEFMERLSEIDTWNDLKTDGVYLASDYADELSDTMSPLAVGAIITTLREKKIITTESSKMGGSKMCYFKLTDLGKWVYKELEKGAVI